MSTVSDLTIIVRDITDLDSVDLPLSLIQQYMKDGFQRIINLERRWPFLQETYSMNTVVNQREYPISGIGSGDLREVISMVDNSTSGNRLTLTSTDYAEAMWNGSLDTPSRPLHYTLWGDTISLYPKPDAVYPITVRGYRKPSYTWLAIAYYAISQSYKRQEDNEMSAMYKQSFDEAVSLARREIMRPDSHRPMVLSKGATRFSEKFWLESLGRTL